MESPGLLPFGLTIEDLPRGVSKLRNRVIARVFHELGLMENWGSGVQRMIAACDEAGCAHPVFEELGGRFRVTLGVSGSSPTADDVDARLLSALRTADGLSTSQLAAAIERTPRTTRTRLKRLVEQGLLREVGSGANDPRRRYYLIE